jgi:hypothetical protein
MSNLETGINWEDASHIVFVDDVQGEPILDRILSKLRKLNAIEGIDYRLMSLTSVSGRRHPAISVVFNRLYVDGLAEFWKDRKFFA